MKGRKTTKFAVVEQQRWNRATKTEGGRGAAAAPHPDLAGQLTLFQLGEKSMSTPLLLAPPDLLTFLRLCDGKLHLYAHKCNEKEERK